MSVISKTITLRVPSNIIYLALKDTRLEKLFPEFFIGITRKLVRLLLRLILKIVKLKLLRISD
jgi:hypothetical protein